MIHKVAKAKHSITTKPEEEIEHEAAQKLEQNYSKDFHSNIFHQNTSGVADQNEAAESAASNFEYDDSLESKTKIQQGIEESMKNLAEDEVDSFAQMLEVRTPAKTHKVEVKAPITEIEGLGGTNIDIDKISFDDFLENKKAKSGAESINEILDFGNSEDSQIKQGNIFYNIMIHGIDTSNIRSDIREALSDRRFLWDPDAVLKNIKSGTLVISKINPVKASILITRLRPLNLQIKWEQYELTN